MGAFPSILPCRLPPASFIAGEAEARTGAATHLGPHRAGIGSRPGGLRVDTSWFAAPRPEPRVHQPAGPAMIEPGPESHASASGNPGAGCVCVCVCVRGRGGGSVHCRGGCSPLPRLSRGPSEGTHLPPGAPGLTCRKHGHLLPSRARNPSSWSLLGRSTRTQDRTRVVAHCPSRLGPSPAGAEVREQQKDALGRESFALHCLEQATGSQVEALGRSGRKVGVGTCTGEHSCSHTHTHTHGHLHMFTRDHTLAFVHSHRHTHPVQVWKQPWI